MIRLTQPARKVEWLNTEDKACQSLERMPFSRLDLALGPSKVLAEVFADHLNANVACRPFFSVELDRS